MKLDGKVMELRIPNITVIEEERQDHIYILPSQLRSAIVVNSASSDLPHFPF